MEKSKGVDYYGIEEPGSRMVSHEFDMGDWRPERTLEVAKAGLLKQADAERGPGSSGVELSSSLPMALARPVPLATVMSVHSSW